MATSEMLLQFVLSGLMVGSIYALIALGFNVVFNATDAINLAQGEGGPRLLLLDELSLGLAPVVVHELYRKIVALHRQGMTILMVEQNARLALSASDRACVLNTGSVVPEGRAQDLLEDAAVRKAYLG